MTQTVKKTISIITALIVAVCMCATIIPFDQAKAKPRYPLKTPNARVFITDYHGQGANVSIMWDKVKKAKYYIITVKKAEKLTGTRWNTKTLKTYKVKEKDRTPIRIAIMYDVFKSPYRYVEVNVTAYKNSKKRSATRSIHEYIKIKK